MADDCTLEEDLLKIRGLREQHAVAFARQRMVALTTYAVGVVCRNICTPAPAKLGLARQHRVATAADNRIDSPTFADLAIPRV